MLIWEEPLLSLRVGWGGGGGGKGLTTKMQLAVRAWLGIHGTLLMGHHKHWTRGPGTQGPRFLRAVLDCSSSNTTMQAISGNAACLTHNYVLYVVAMNTESVIYSRQRYSLTSLILRVVYCQFCKARLAHRHDTQSKRVWRLVAFDLWPLDHSANNYRELVTLVVLHALKETILGFAEWRIDKES